VRIGEVGDRSGVNPTTIRYYEDIGLLPEPERTPSGYREYTETAVARISFIRAAQSIGLSLGEIREVLALRQQGEAPCPHVITLLDQRATELSERIAALERMRNELLELAQHARQLPPRPDAEFCHIIEGAPVDQESCG
jgi:DNA-binding transcriptional MerR regulator